MNTEEWEQISFYSHMRNKDDSMGYCKQIRLITEWVFDDVQVCKYSKFDST